MMSGRWFFATQGGILGSMKPGPMITLGVGAFVLFAVLAGLALLSGANYAAPGCTGPAVQPCDYVATAKAALQTTNFQAFYEHRDIEVFDRGSSVLVQERTPPGPYELDEGPAVLIDKRSCRVCSVEGHIPRPASILDMQRGTLILRVPAEGGPEPAVPS